MARRPREGAHDALLDAARDEFAPERARARPGGGHRAPRRDLEGRVLPALPHEGRGVPRDRAALPRSARGPRPAPPRGRGSARARRRRGDRPERGGRPSSRRSARSTSTCWSCSGGTARSCPAVDGASREAVPRAARGLSPPHARPRRAPHPRSAARRRPARRRRRRGDRRHRRRHVRGLRPPDGGHEGEAGPRRLGPLAPRSSCTRGSSTAPPRGASAAAHALADPPVIYGGAPMRRPARSLAAACTAGLALAIAACGRAPPAAPARRPTGGRASPPAPLPPPRRRASSSRSASGTPRGPSRPARSRRASRPRSR